MNRHDECAGVPRASGWRNLACALFAGLALPGTGQEREGADGVAPLAVTRVTADRVRARVFEPVTLDIELSRGYENPFDSASVRLDAEVTDKGGGRRTVPGFWYQPFIRRIEDDVERFESGGQPVWRVRLSFPSPGDYAVTVKAVDRKGTATADPVRITVTPADVPGMIRVHPWDRRYFATDRGETFFPIGANVCWGGGRGTFNYDDWLARYAESGGNFFRVWLSPHWATFAMNTQKSGFDRIDAENAWRLDYVLQRAERLGLRVMLCIDSFNILRSENAQHGKFESSPYHAANGGPIRRPREYFSNADSLRAYRDRLRYLVARYGYSTSVFAWEFWNEVDIISEYDSKLATRWHADMAKFLREMDPWDHLITTSTARHQGDPRLDALPELDFVQTHHYQAKDMASALGHDRRAKKAASDRPHFHGEFGIRHSGAETARIDPDGVHLHNGLYSCVGQEQAGTPMTWWWDSYVHPRDLYGVFRSFARWVDGFDFAAQHSRPIDARVSVDGLSAAAHVPLRVSGLRGDTRALVWVQNEQYTWPKAATGGPDSQPVEEAKLSIAGLAPGAWTVEWWDTHAGVVARAEPCESRKGCDLDIVLPPIARDLALRLKLIGK